MSLRHDPELSLIGRAVLILATLVSLAWLTEARLNERSFASLITASIQRISVPVHHAIGAP